MSFGFLDPLCRIFSRRVWLGATHVPVFFVLAVASNFAQSEIPVTSEAVDASKNRVLLWGDTHLHTTYSSDAFANNNLRATPDTAYRYAMGRPVVHPFHSARVQINRPLDFLAVSDHAEFLGFIRKVYFDGPNLEGVGFFDKLKAQIATSVLRKYIDEQRGRDLFVDVLPVPEPAEDAARELSEGPELQVGWLPVENDVEVDTWKNITDTADKYYRPGEFTTLVAWEWSAIPGGANLHRIVISDMDGTTAQSFEPFGLDDSTYPEDLWDFLEQTSEVTGSRFVAIPHNSNISKGRMFNDRTLKGEDFTPEYIRKRRLWEPVAEVTQIKGDSETHPDLSPDDSFADFETYPYYIQNSLSEYKVSAGDYMRSGLLRGLAMEKTLGSNPYQFGVIGSTDSHTALASAEEDNFHGKMATDSIPANKGDGFGNKKGTSGWAMSAAGLAAVWAEENTREAILDAFQRREVYATTGPRIGLRFFASTDRVVPSVEEAVDVEAFVDRAVAMGGELTGATSAPAFYVEALHDPQSAYLDRVQIVKGWVDPDGNTHERVYDVALSDPVRKTPTGVTPVGDSVDRTTGEVNNSIGAPSLSSFWVDPDFDPTMSAFYYARVLQIPTARHSFLDALALGLEHAGDQPDTIQERAYSSPIWFTP